MRSDHPSQAICAAAAQKQTIASLAFQKLERTNNIYRLPIDQVVELEQKMTYKDGEYADYNIKFLFYLQGNQLIGDCVVNLAYFLNGNVQDFQKIKKPLTSTNDKKAALYFKINTQRNLTESQEIPQSEIPAPTENPQLATRSRIDSRREHLATARNSVASSVANPPQRVRAKSNSPSRVLKQSIVPTPKEEPVEVKDPVNENLTQKFQELDNKFAQEKEKIQQVQDDFHEITAVISRQEEELQSQLSYIDTQIESLKQQTSDCKLRKSLDQFITHEQHMEAISQQKFKEIYEKYERTNEENEHLKRIIRSQGETIRELKASQATSSQAQSSYSNGGSQKDSETYEKTIEKKNQKIDELSRLIIEYERNSRPSQIEGYKQEIKRLESIVDELKQKMHEQEELYKVKMLELLKRES